MRKLLCLFLLLGFTLYTLPVLGQSKVSTSRQKQKKRPVDDDDDEPEDLPEDLIDIKQRKRGFAKMTNAFSLELPMNRTGTGTSWNPDRAPMYGYMLFSDNWIYTIGGHIFPRYSHQDIEGVTKQRGGAQWDLPGFVSFSAQRKVGYDGQIHYKAMATTDRLFMRREGSPALLQAGSSYGGVATPDWQHPRDVIAELSGSYSWSFADHNDVFFYGGYPGEPALGPVSYFQRSSCQFMPDAPLMHSRTDAAFTAWGVGTIGVRLGKFKVEASVFNGKQPGDDHYNVEKPAFNSYSGRLSWNPSAKWSLQVSGGLLKSADLLRPNDLVQRNTASATYVYPIGSRTYIASSLILGQNKVKGQPETWGALYEATMKMKRVTLYSRYEYLLRSPGNFYFPTWQYNANTLFNVHTATFGGAFDLIFFRGVNLALGAQATGYLYDDNLKRIYGSYPYSGEVYLHIYPLLQ